MDRRAAASVSRTNFGGRGNATMTTAAIVTGSRLGVRATTGLRISSAASGGAATNRVKSNPARNNPAMRNGANRNGTRTNGVRHSATMIGGTIASAMSLATTASRMNNCA